MLSPSVHVVPEERFCPSVLVDVPKYLGRFTWLPALAHLDVLYDTDVHYDSLSIFRHHSSQSLAVFLRVLARTLQPLQNLKVLKFVCPTGELWPTECHVRSMEQERRAQQETFRNFATSLDDVDVRGIDGEALYPFAKSCSVSHQSSLFGSLWT